MTTIEVELPEQGVIVSHIEAAVLATAASFDLVVTTDGDLATLPGSRHWHLKRTRQSGVLEVTWDPNPCRIWVSFHSNRTGDGWVAALAPDFASRLSENLAALLQEPGGIQR